MGNNNLEEKNVSMPEKIGGVIFGIWFVASIIAGFVASEIGTDAVMLVVGQFFAGIVLVIILKTLIPTIKKRKRGSIIGIVFISVFAGAASALIWAACAVKDGSFADKIVLLPERILGRENCNVGAFYAPTSQQISAIHIKRKLRICQVMSILSLSYLYIIHESYIYHQISRSDPTAP